MQETSEGFLYPDVNAECVHCGICIHACPALTPPAIDVFEKECYKTCSSFCCRWDHEDFPRFLIPKGGTLFYLPKEMIYIKK